MRDYITDVCGSHATVEKRFNSLEQMKNLVNGFKTTVTLSVYDFISFLRMKSKAKQKQRMVE